MEYDVFISHASEDKEDVARPLAVHLQKLGLRVWLDEFELTLGDSLRRTIDRGLSRSRYGLVILSPAFFLKEWPNKELDGLVAREDGREKVVLPIWHNVSSVDILKYSPTLADKVAVSTAHGLAHVANRIFEAVQRASTSDGKAQAPPSESEGELLARLRKQMLLSPSAWELRRDLYKLEGYLASYPHSPEGRLLRDQIHDAMRRAQRMEYPMPAPPTAGMRTARARRWLFALPTWFFILGTIGFSIYYTVNKTHEQDNEIAQLAGCEGITAKITEPSNGEEVAETIYVNGVATPSEVCRYVFVVVRDKSGAVWKVTDLVQANASGQWSAVARMDDISHLSSDIEIMAKITSRPTDYTIGQFLSSPPMKGISSTNIVRVRRVR